MKIWHLCTAVVIAFSLTVSGSVLAQNIASPIAPKAKPDVPKSERVKSADPFKGLAKRRDDMNGITWYRNPSSPKHHNSNSIYLYFGKNDSGEITQLRLVCQYAASNWLFVERAWAKADSMTVNLPQESGRFLGWERDNATVLTS